jgi:rhodanese-related sulfurtransferase
MMQTFPSRPKSFSHIIHTNTHGVPLLDRCPVVRDLSPAQVKAQIENGAKVLDTRDTAAFGGVHIPGSINIGFAKQTANWIGMVLEPEAKLILIVTDEDAFEAMTVHLHRIGYDNIIGYLYGGMAAWQEAGLPINQLWQISTEKLKQKISKGNYSVLYDVRTPAEYEDGHIEQARSLPLTDLLNQAPDIAKNEEVIVTCGVGYRGNIAASFLQSQGFNHVHSLAGGMSAWMNSGGPVV